MWYLLDLSDQLDYLSVNNPCVSCGTHVRGDHQ